MRKSFLAENPSVLWFIAILAVFTVVVTLLSEVTGVGLISTSFVKTLGKTLCLCLIAIAMDVVWGYCGILSLGHFAFFGIGGYAIGMWLMYARTEGIVIESLAGQPIPPTPAEISDAIGNQIFGVVGSSDFPMIWAFADSLVLQLLMVVLVPGLLALEDKRQTIEKPGDGCRSKSVSHASDDLVRIPLLHMLFGVRTGDDIYGLHFFLQWADRAPDEVPFVLFEGGKHILASGAHGQAVSRLVVGAV